MLRWESEQRQWALAASGHTWWGKSEQRKIWASARQGMQAGRRFKSVYEVCSDDERIGLIGSALKAGGEKWARTHGRQMAWLREQGISPAEAIQRHQIWLARQLSDPRFVPAKKRAAPAS